MKNFRKYICFDNSNLKKTLNNIKSNRARCSVIVDKNFFLVGTITDGDIRKKILKGKINLKQKVRNICNKRPKFLLKDSLNFKKLRRLFIKSKHDIVPIVDRNKIVIDVIFKEDFLKKNKIKKKYVKSLNAIVVIMAGGFGTRLHPLTKETPKPLLKIGSKPILEMIIEQFISYGFHNFFISTHFKSEQIRNYFKNGKIHNITIQYLHEDNPLGTAGSLGLLPDNLPDLPIIVMNGDLLTKVDFINLLDFHYDHDSEATMCVREYQVPYGVVQIDNYNIKEIKEKPVHKFFVNAGIYVLNKTLINKLDGKSYLDMTDLLDKELINEKINAFPIHEYWLDIGKIEEYERANREVFTEFN